jgi:diguanylate cyclase (GGDEF)-like protein
MRVEGYGAPPETSDPHLGANLFRVITIVVALGFLLSRLSDIAVIPPSLGFVLLVLIFLSRCIPVAVSREKPITFTAALVFTSAILLNGPMAGAAALVVCALHALIFRRGDWFYTLFLGAQYALAALAASGTFYLLSGRTHASTIWDLTEYERVCLAAIDFIAVNAALVGLGNLGTVQSKRSAIEPMLKTQALSYLFSFQFAVLIVFVHHAFGVAALPCLAAVLLVSAQAVRIAVENRMLSRQLWAVEALGRVSATDSPLETPLNRFLSLARELVAYDTAVLWLTEEPATNIQPRAVFPRNLPMPSASEAAPDTLLARAFDQIDPILIADAGSDPRLEHGEPGESWLLYPLLLHGNCIGVAQFKRSSRPFMKVDARRLAALVPQAAVAFESVRVRGLMHLYADMATTDGLTGLLNHRRSQEVLQEELWRATRYGRPLALLMVDVDAFKQFNDAYGHPQGDTLLTSIARLLRSSVRNVDHVGRYGGEEFVVILPETTRDEAGVLAERIRANVEAEWFDAGNDRTVRKTISIGLAGYPEDGESPEELLQNADDALYRAKRTGKNRVLTA